MAEVHIEHVIMMKPVDGDLEMTFSLIAYRIYFQCSTSRSCYCSYSITERYVVLFLTFGTWAG